VGSHRRTLPSISERGWCFFTPLIRRGFVPLAKTLKVAVVPILLVRAGGLIQYPLADSIITNVAMETCDAAGRITSRPRCKEPGVRNPDTDERLQRRMFAPPISGWSLWTIW